MGGLKADFLGGPGVLDMVANMSEPCWRHVTPMSATLCG